ncbi:SMI1 / KNR4 family protein [Photorhabdus australis subsp. thailandensis]|uniref:SMI1 / KNR4 family protein n=1 Tax=Photorhabdus australis subsp. thailandensis TaxID=2805096 RepID=A0A1C0U9Y9_9GAMM|nr:SMI1/KNR4 family protein [Photorhabdus australis]OCQ54676.1 SMI1 / KNR4 family protein [Photorhabdus australis subsp. thailandensis]
MKKEDILEKLNSIEKELNIKLPNSYRKFLSEKIQNEPYIEITGKDQENIYVYNCEYVIERNKTYNIQDVEPNYFLIGQDGDLGYFICAEKDKESDIIYSLDLGALGSVEMDKEADKEANDIYSLGI